MAKCIMELGTWMAACCSFVLPIASAQNLTDQVVTKAASPLIESKVVDGLSIGYIEGDHYGIVHLGISNSEGKQADNLTVYELGSVSKVFTSLLLADAVVRGEIELDAAADVANAAGIRLPSREGRSIQWIDLSTHRSGLPKLPANLDATSLTNPYQHYDSKKAAKALKSIQLSRKPGESQEYSNFGASVLGYLVAENGGTTYQELLQERIAKPLGMTDCTVALTSDQKARFAVPHDRVGSATLAWTFADMPGAGEVHATMRDMMRFAKAQLTPPTGTLGQAIELAWKQHHDADASGPAMGLGWMIARDGETRWHNGQTGGSHSAIFINRRLNTAIIVLCNTAVINEVDELATQLLQLAAGLDVKTATSGRDEWGSLVIDAELRGRLVGRYQLNPSFIIDVEDKDGHLMVGITNQPTQEVFPDSATRWSYRSVKATLAFDLTITGPAKSLVIDQNGLKQTARRIDVADDQVIDAALRARLVGKYQLAPNFIFDVKDQDGHLMVGITNQPTQEVFPESATQWKYRSVDATLEFELGRTGPASNLVLYQNGVKQTASRMGR